MNNELRDNKSQFRTVFDNHKAIMLLINQDTGSIIAANLAAEKFYGYSREEFAQLKIFEINQLATLEVAQEMKKATTEETCYFNFVHKLANGNCIEVEVNSCPIDFEGKEVLFSIIHDISARKTAQAMLANKNKELENYLFAVSHDLRSPLVNILGFSQRFEKHLTSIKTLLADCDLSTEMTSRLNTITNEDIPKTLSFIFSNVKKMETLLNGLLQVSKTGRGLMTINKIDMNKLFQAIITTHNFQLTEAGVQVLIADLPDCYGDETFLNQLFSNLIGNAIKYRNSSKQLIIEITALAKFNKVVYSIKDNGIGIEQRDIDKIWTVFYQVDSTAPFHGEGLGLSVVKKIAEKHQGNVWVESESGKGSTFFVELHATDFPE